MTEVVVTPGLHYCSVNCINHVAGGGSPEGCIPAVLLWDKVNIPPPAECIPCCKRRLGE